MIIRSLHLKNIRSYTDQTLTFPEGTTLLAGDIGVGKSSILLAIEFALFGVKRTELSGAGLLRHGKKEGTVELTVDIDGKEVIIKRTLKRSKEEVKQDSGFIIINGRKKEGSPVELRAEVIALLGYPKETITKPKDYLYRYTVYTPQEEMKSILFEDRDLRLDTLRKVFDIDRYKGMVSNASIIMKDIRDSIRLYQSKSADTQQKITQLQNSQKTLADFSAAHESKAKKKEEQEKVISRLKESVQKLEQEMEGIKKVRSELTHMVSEWKSCISVIGNMSSQIFKLEQDTSKIGTELQQLSPPFNQTELEQLRTNIDQLQTQEREMMKTLGECSATKSAAEKTMQQLIHLDNCPLCLQSVSQTHKDDVIRREHERKSISIAHETYLQSNILTLRQHILEHQQKMNTMMEAQRKQAKAEGLRRSLQSFQQQVDKLKSERMIIETKKSEQEQKKNELEIQEKELTSKEELYKKSLHDWQRAIEDKQIIEQELMKVEKDRQGIIF